MPRVPGVQRAVRRRGAATGGAALAVQPRLQAERPAHERGQPPLVLPSGNVYSRDALLRSLRWRLRDPQTQKWCASTSCGRRSSCDACSRPATYSVYTAALFVHTNSTHVVISHVFWRESLLENEPTAPAEQAHTTQRQ